MVDHHNADEARSARTLSGGETFLASLALALALADQLAAARGQGQRPARVDLPRRGIRHARPRHARRGRRRRSRSSAPAGAWSASSPTCAELAERVPVRFEVTKGAVGAAGPKGRVVTRFAVEAWAPEYGAVAAEAALTQSEVPTDLSVEVDEADWAPRRPPPDTPEPGSILFVDGVRRVDARVWLTTDDDDGVGTPGICASYAAGAVRCEGRRAEIVEARVERGTFARVVNGMGPIEAAIGRMRLAFPPVTAASDEFEQLSLCLQDRMGRLEATVAGEVAAATPVDLVLVDGPLRERHRLPEAVGYVKHHQTGYGPPVRAPHDRPAGPRRADPAVLCRQPGRPVLVVRPAPRQRRPTIRWPVSSAASRVPTPRSRPRWPGPMPSPVRCPASRRWPTRIPGRPRTSSRSPASSATCAGGSVTRP